MSVAATARELALPYSTVNSWVRRNQSPRTAKQDEGKVLLETSGPRQTVSAKLAEFQFILWAHVLDAEHQTLESALVEVTGLSRSRVRQGRLDCLRPSKQQEAERHRDEWLVKQLGGGIKGMARAESLLASSPPTPLAAGIHAMAPDTDGPLPYTTALATKVDRLVLDLLEACAAGDLARFGGALRDSLALIASKDALHGQWLTTDMPEHAGEVAGLNSWEEAASALSEILNALYFDLLAALDAEWFAWWFGRVLDRPMFSLVFPAAPGIQEKGGELQLIAKRNAVKGPVRSLLQVMHGLVHFRRRGKWPGRAAGAVTLAQCLAYSEQDIRNYFDGTRRLSLKQADKMWDQLLLNFQTGKRSDGRRITPPYPLMILAIRLQKRSVQVNHPGLRRSVIVPDTEIYARLWSVHSSNLRSLADEAPAVSGQGAQAPRPMAWPIWL